MLIAGAFYVKDERRAVLKPPDLPAGLAGSALPAASTAAMTFNVGNFFFVELSNPLACH